MYKFEASAGAVLLAVGRHALTLLFGVMGWGKPGDCAAICEYVRLRSRFVGQSPKPVS